VQKPIKNLTLENVTTTAKSGMKIDWVTGLKLTHVNIKQASGEPINIKNCSEAVNER
jgi:hypothetical protein